MFQRMRCVNGQLATAAIVWFARQVFPSVLTQVLDARFVIVGKNPPEEVSSLSGRNGPIQVTGYVSDPTPYLAETAVLIVPLHAGGGMRVKIPDAWCWGLPVVSTSVGAEGIDVRAGQNILIADSPETLAAAVIRVLQNRELGVELGQSGRHWVKERYNWRKQYSAWDAVYEGLVPS